MTKYLKQNLKKMAAVKRHFIPAIYDLCVEFKPHNEGINAPLKSLNRAQRSLETGSGYNFSTGQRDFSFQGTEEQMKGIMLRLCDGPFKIHKFSVYPNASNICDFNDQQELKAHMEFQAKKRKRSRAKAAR